MRRSRRGCSVGMAPAFHLTRAGDQNTPELLSSRQAVLGKPSEAFLGPLQHPRPRRRRVFASVGHGGKEPTPKKEALRRPSFPSCVSWGGSEGGTAASGQTSQRSSLPPPCSLRPPGDPPTRAERRKRKTDSGKSRVRRGGEGGKGPVRAKRSAAARPALGIPALPSGRTAQPDLSARPGPAMGNAATAKKGNEIESGE